LRYFGPRRARKNVKGAKATEKFTVVIYSDQLIHKVTKVVPLSTTEAAKQG